MGVFKRALVGSLSINNHPYILTLEPFNENKGVGPPDLRGARVYVLVTCGYDVGGSACGAETKYVDNE